MRCFIKEPTVKDYQPKRIRVEWVETWRDAEGDLVEEGLQREFTNGINGWKRAASFAFELGAGYHHLATCAKIGGSVTTMTLIALLHNSEELSA